ncbi:MAG: hypothetical protein OIF55_06415 [Amphritea sp.]|nr:hypothetical protein [Amphritea sp.]
MRSLMLVFLVTISSFVIAGQPLSQSDYRLLTKAGKLIETEQLEAAYQLLSEADSGSRKGYSKALIAYNLGQIDLRRERFKSAIKHLEVAFTQQAMPSEQQLSLKRTLAQLNCMEERWKRCISLLKSWLAEAPEKVTANDQILLAQAYSQTERWREVIKPAAAAINSRADVPESWYQLKIFAHIRLNQWRSAIRDQQRMMTHYTGNPAHWRQLVSLHQQNRDHKSALASQRIGYERGLLSSAADHRLLAGMLLQAQLPFFAGEVVQQGIDRKILKANKRTLELLSRCWIQAKESRRAVAALAKLNDVAPGRQSLTRMAYMQIELQEWQQAQLTLQRALKLGGKKVSELQLMLGIVRIKLRQFEGARQALSVAAENRNMKSAADGWLRYLDQVSPEQTLLSAR